MSDRFTVVMASLVNRTSELNCWYLMDMVDSFCACDGTDGVPLGDRPRQASRRHSWRDGAIPQSYLSQEKRGFTKLLLL